jgi:hypothetical protein
MIGFRQADPRFPFLWESPMQPAGRWHGDGEGPAHYLADTPHGAWAEFLRHEEITDPVDVPTIRRALWAIEVGEVPFVSVNLSPEVATGDPSTYPPCQQYASRARRQRVNRLSAPSAALLPGGAAGVRVDHGEQPASPRGGRVLVVYGPPGALVGWKVVEAGAPPAFLLARVRHYGRTRRRA